MFHNAWKNFKEKYVLPCPGVLGEETTSKHRAGSTRIEEVHQATHGCGVMIPYVGHGILL